MSTRETQIESIWQRAPDKSAFHAYIVTSWGILSLLIYHLSVSDQSIINKTN